MGGIVWSPNGAHIASFGVQDNMVQVWSAVTGKQISWLTGSALMSGGFSLIQGQPQVTWSQDSQWIALAGTNVQIRDVTTGALIHTYQGRSNQEVYTVSWSPHGQFIASGNQDNTVQIWQTQKRNGDQMRG